jgi:CTP:molybdopterin cytidylyltransferase MocA
VLGNVRAASVNDIVLVLGFAAEAIVRKVATEGLKVVINESYQQGMGSSLRVGLSALDTLIDASLIVLADQPFVRSQTLDQIIEVHRQSNAQIVIPMYQGFRGNPVLLDRSVFPEVMALSGDVGCRAIFGDHLEGIVKVPVDDIGVLLDIDNQAEFARLRNFGQGAQDPGALIDAADLRGREIPAAGGLSVDKPQLIVVGTERVALALAKLGKLMGFMVAAVDPLLKASDLPEVDVVLNTLDFSHLEAASGRYVVVASGGKFDEEAVEQAFDANSDYVALVANRRRGQEMRHRLEAKGHATDKLATLHVPAGLDIGAKTPEEIALSIMAEIVSVRRRIGGNK